MTLDFRAIERAVQEEKNAGGFADLMKAFQKLGVVRYDYLVESGMYRYFDATSTIDLKMNGVAKTVALKGDGIAIKRAVQQAQAGLITFEVFCELAGEAGILYWSTDLDQKVVSYFDRDNQIQLAEPIPGL